MSSFLYRIGRFSARRRWWVIAVWLILAVGGGALSNFNIQQGEKNHEKRI